MYRQGLILKRRGQIAGIRFRQLEKDSTYAAETYGRFRLEIREDVDYGILGFAMVMLRSSTKMGVDHGRTIYDVSMRKQADTGIIAAEQQQKESCQICPQMSHLKKTAANITYFSRNTSVLCFFHL